MSTWTSSRRDSTTIGRYDCKQYDTWCRIKDICNMKYAHVDYTWFPRVWHSWTIYPSMIRCFPWCKPQLRAEHSIELGKQTYGGTKWWLPDDHKYKLPSNHFNGKIDRRSKSRAVIEEEQLQYASKYKAWKQARNKEGAVGDPSKIHGIKRRSILYWLPYWKVKYSCTSWKYNLLRRTL